MNLNDFKLYALNSIAMVVSFTDVEALLKIVLLCITIIYTVMKIVEMKNKKGDGIN
jgi:flagellar biogenesis protein FliO